MRRRKNWASNKALHLTAIPLRSSVPRGAAEAVHAVQEMRGGPRDRREGVDLKPHQAAVIKSHGSERYSGPLF